MVFKDMKEAITFSLTNQFLRMFFLWTFSLIISYFHLFIFFLKTPIYYTRISPPFLYKPGESQNQRPICIITGVTSGLGAAAAYSLSLEGFFVVLVGRSTRRLAKVEEDIRIRNKNSQLKCFKVDVSSFESILKFKISFQRWLSDANYHSSVQLLINNAGILATSSRSTVEGYDQMIATNYLGAFCLTKVLLPLLENSPVPSRIVNVSSFTHRSASGVQVDKESVCGEHFSKLKIYPCAQIYEYSKFCLLLFSYELHRQYGLARRSKHVSVIAVDPGAVSTSIMREVPTYLSFAAHLVLKLLGLLQSPITGSRCILDAALAPPEISGVYFFGGNGRTVNSSAISYKANLAKELWDSSCDLFSERQKTWNNSSS